MCTVKKISPSEIKFFIHVILVTAPVAVFNVFHVVTVVSTSRTFNIVSSFECVIVLVISF